MESAMRNFLFEFVLPLLLLIAALLNWSFVSLIDLVAFLLIHCDLSRSGFHFRRRSLLLWLITTSSLFFILSQTTFLILVATRGDEWTADVFWWADLIGLMRIQSWRSPVVIYFLVLQVLVVFIALLCICGSRLNWPSRDSSSSRRFSDIIDHLGSNLRVVSCLCLPAIQLIVGISHPSWVSLPFFLGSSAGLVDCSLTSNFLGLFRWWNLLRVYSGFNIVLLYVYQLPIQLPTLIRQISDFIGLYKISANSEWPEICSGVSLLVFYTMLSYIKCDLIKMNLIVSMKGNDLTEELLPSRHSFFIRESKSGVRHTNVLLRGAVFRTFSINFFTYGFPISLFALSYWSFHFTSICAFGLLAYVGYILYSFPSLFRLHRLNGLLLVFILLWAALTYVFNVAFALLSEKIGKDIKIWEIVGFWHYPIPGLYLLAQFCLGVLVAVGNLVNNSVFQYMSGEEGQSSMESNEEVEDETKVLVVATIAWGLRKSSRAIILILIFLVGMNPGFIHAVYILFFLIYLLSHNISRKMKKSLILLCEVHFAIIYILQLKLISNTFIREGSISKEILSQLGLLDPNGSWEFLEIALLACFCSMHNHGFDMLFSLSMVVQHTPKPPVGFSVLKAGLNKSVILSLYSSQAIGNNNDHPSHERKIASFLGAIGQKFLCMYRSCGTYIVVFTILISVYLVTPNYISVGYMTLLLFWLIGRQLVEKTKRPLWFPLKAYSIAIFIFIYILSIFPRIQLLLSKWMDLYKDLGYDPEASLLQNVWESLAILTVMQLYSYERRQSEQTRVEYSRPVESGLFGFIKRLLIWHSEKILFAALFYATLTPICAFGLVYLLALVVFSVLPKASRIPSKSCLVYSGVLMVAEYLYQMLGGQVEMFPGQKHSDIASLLGFRVFEPGFWGLEYGLRGKFVVIAACILQYNTFRWLENMPREHLNAGKWEEPCLLFVPAKESPTDEDSPSSEPFTKSKKYANINSNSWPSFNTNESQSVPPKSGKPVGVGTRKFSFEYIWGSTKESHKWNKKLIHVLKKERFETQITTLIVYLKFWLENMSNLFGLEINMIVLLLASFAVLNVISMLYIVALAACILSGRRFIRKAWPLVVAMFASVLILEYIAIWKSSWFQSHNTPSEATLCCHDCYKSSNTYFQYCEYCWLGYIVDDPRMLISYFMVFMFSCFKLRADHSSSFSGSFTYHQMMSQRRNVFVWKDLSFETKSMWTFLDYVRLYCYCHLLDLVLALILITGTLEYDVLHLGYLGFALVFFRMRPEILKKRNKIFRFLRMYNFTVIVLSLVYQSPFFGDSSGGKWPKLDYIFEVIGFHKYDYGFRITSRSALVEIVIFMLVALQSFVLSSEEFDHVSRYLEAEQIGAIVREQEKKAARKTAQLQHICQTEEQKRQRNMQVEKMKAEMLNLQVQLHSMNSGDVSISSPHATGLRMRSNSLTPIRDTRRAYKDDGSPLKEGQHMDIGTVTPFDLNESPISASTEPSTGDSPSLGTENRSSLCEITEIDEDNIDNLLVDTQTVSEAKRKAKENSLTSAVQLLGDGVSHVQLFGNQAVNHLANLLNVPQDDSDSNGHSSTDEGMYDEIESQRIRHTSLGRSTSMLSDRATSDSASLQIGRITRHIWSQIQSNNDIVCYCCFVLIFLWNFGLLSMVYLAALFLYALCVNTGPSYMFWKVMLIYTEFYILVEYLYQILIQHGRFGFRSNLLLMELGFPTNKITSSFVISSLPLFLVYLFTLIQSSITAKDGEWKPSAYLNSRRRKQYASETQVPSNWIKSAKKFLYYIRDALKKVVLGVYWYCKSLIHVAESSPYFIQLSLDVPSWPEDGIQPERIESGVNQMLRIVQEERCKGACIDHCHSSSRVHVQSIERSSENPSVVIAVLEVVYAAPLTGCVRGGWYKSLTPAADVAKEISEAKNAGYVEQIGFPYPILTIIGGGKREVDLYAYIFGADLTVFFLVAVFYQSIIKNNSEFLEVYQLEDQFPKEFVFVLIIIFFLIVLDRILYLCSFATGKVLFYIGNIVLYTYSVTQYAWYIESSQRHAGRYALRAIFFMKAISLALQAIQIRYGLPHQSTLYCQFLTSEVSYINYMGYRIYRALPFLYELRCVLDWSCTTTSLTMYDWLKLEDIHSSLYLVKCDAVLNRSQHQIGQKQTKITKFCNGICLFFILICVIWAPMLMYSSGNPTNMANPIRDASVQVDVKSDGGRLTIFQTTMCEKYSWASIEAGTDLDPLGILSTYGKDDVQLICCQADSSTAWLIPNSVQNRFIRSLDMGMEISITWILNRDRPKGKEIAKYEQYVDHLDLPEPSEVQEVLNGTANSFRIRDIYPRYFRVTGSGEVRLFEQQVGIVSADLLLNHEFPGWWSFYDLSSSNLTGCGDLTGPMAIVVSEETPPQGILGDTLSKFSIWGLYITFVLAVGRFVRLQCSDLRMRIPYENLPTCDRLIAICEDIYAARAEGELGVEEVLYWTLVKIYRSPHMLLEYTKVD
ncbi:hypothetical protein QQ045_021419 [Rhodiola kirilowii]